VTIGQIADGHVTLRYTFDERVEDGHYCAGALKLLAERIEDPAAWQADFVRPEAVSGLVPA
jgi:pyruvate/2-oxoglutarate dehydrogenase complex dihydrolipoamide acyltransferase (E2) component